MEVMTMKLAEALNERKAMQERLARLRARLAANARVQEGDAPAERPEALLTEIGEVTEALERLIVRINLTNVAAAVEAVTADADGPRLMEAVARRDMLKVRFVALAELVAAAQPNPRQFAVTRSEIRSVATVDVAEMQKRLDALARDIRELDTRLQAANWAVDLAE
jgi:hypothetical protein